MQPQAMKNKLDNFGHSTYEWSVLIFAFKAGIAWYKINVKIHHNILIFLYLEQHSTADEKFHDKKETMEEGRGFIF